MTGHDRDRSLVIGERVDDGVIEIGALPHGEDVGEAQGERPQEEEERVALRQPEGRQGSAAGLGPRPLPFSPLGRHLSRLSEASWTERSPSATAARALKTERPSAFAEGLPKNSRRRPTLPHSLPCSTIGAGGLNFSVRNGKRCFPSAIATPKFAAIDSSSDP